MVGERIGAGMIMAPMLVMLVIPPACLSARHTRERKARRFASWVSE
jgi:hypothetical protein